MLIQIYCRDTKTNKSSKKGLFKICVFLVRKILNNRRELMMISNQQEAMTFLKSNRHVEAMSFSGFFDD